MSSTNQDPLAVSTGRFRSLMQQARTPTGAIAIFGTLTLIGIAIFAPIIFGEKAAVVDVTSIAQGPSADHWLGTDASGRDILLRTLVATQLSLMYGMVATVIGVTLGIVVGCLPSVLPPAIGRIIVAFVNMMIAFPSLLLVLFLAVVLGQGTTGAVVALGLAIVPDMARLCQTMSASVSGRDFISAAKILGVPRFVILIRHIIPSITDVVVVNATMIAAGCLTAMAGLSFLGLGLQPPAYDWGRLLAEGLSRLYISPAAALAPALAVTLAGIVLTMLGDTIGRALGVNPVISLRKMAGFSGRKETTTQALETEPQAQELSEYVLSVRNLHVSFPAHGEWITPVRGVSFDIAAGERVGIVGESGSGKSLTALAISQLIEDPARVDADTVMFDGVELAGLSRREIDSHASKLGLTMSMVFQDPMSSLNPSTRIGPQVSEVAKVHGHHSTSVSKKMAIDRLNEVGIPDPELRFNQYPFQFSGGMRQRAMIAMGLMGNPRLIIADEPTTALDATVQRTVLEVLDRVTVEHGSAVMFISHDIALVTGFCDRVLVMYQGELVEDISTSDLVAGLAVHPYTRALMASIPTLTTDKTRPLATVGDFMKEQPS